MKNVLKFLTIIALVAVIGFSFAACNNDNDNGNDNGDNGKKEEDTPISSFAGTWNASGGRSVVFSGNTFNYKVNGTTTYSGTFSVSGSTITFNTVSGAASGNFQLAGEALVLSNHTWDSTVNGTYTKDNGTGGGDTKEVDPKLIGKWEWETLTVSGVQHNLPFSDINSGGYIFTSNSHTDYVNGNIRVNYSSGVYTENNKLYVPGNTEGSLYSLTATGDKLTVFAIDGLSSVIAKKVTNFSWDNSTSGGNNPFIGKWNMTAIDGVSITCTDSTWTLSGSSGTFTYNGNTATFIQTNGATYGTATVSGNTMTIVTSSGGTSTWTKDSGSGGGGNSLTWTAVADSKFGSSDIMAIAYGNNNFVAVGESGKITYSNDGITWNAVSNSTSTSIFRAIAYGSDKFVAGGGGGKMAYSNDGITWNAVSNSTFTNNINAIAYGGNKFVAVGRDGKIAYSDDGITWNAVNDSTFSTTEIFVITYDGSKFVAVSYSSGLSYTFKVAHSTNGITWNVVSDSLSTLFTSGIKAIAYGGGKFVGGGYGKMGYSSDGITWIAINDSTFGTYQINSIVYGSGKFVVGVTSYDTSPYSSKTVYSDDGITWNTISNNAFGSTYIYAIAYGGNKFVAVGDKGNMVYSGN